MRRFLRSLFSGSTSTEKPQIDLINCRRAELAKLDDHELKASAGRAGTLLELIAVTAVVVARLLGLGMFDALGGSASSPALHGFGPRATTISP